MGKMEETVDKIMQATMKIAMQKGFANTRTAEIAKEAGVSEGLIFKYFPTKNHLFAIIIDHNFKRLKNGVEKIIADQEKTASEKIAALVAFHFSFFLDRYNILQMVFGHSGHKGSVDLESVFRHAFRPYMQLVMQILQEGIAAREFRPVREIETIATAIIGTMQATILSLVFNGDALDIEATQNEITTYILAGLQPVHNPVDRRNG